MIKFQSMFFSLAFQTALKFFDRDNETREKFLRNLDEFIVSINQAREGLAIRGENSSLPSHLKEMMEELDIIWEEFQDDESRGEIVNKALSGHSEMFDVFVELSVLLNTYWYISQEAKIT